MFFNSEKTGNNLIPLRVIHVKNPGIFLAMILLAGLLLRVYISFFTNLPHIHRDTSDYLTQADALLNGTYINYFPNGYPLLIALEKLLFGNSIENFLLWTNIILATFTLYFSWSISRLLFRNEFLALITVFVLAILPTQINIVRWVITEVPTSFFLMGSYFFYFRKRFIWSGIFMSAAILIRTEILLIFILLVLCELIFLRKINFRFIVAGIIPLLLMGYYCYTKTGDFSIAGHSKVNIAYAITASGSNIDWTYIDKHPEIKTKEDAIRKYMEHMKAEPLQYTKERLANFSELWGVPSSSGGTRSNLSRLLMGAGNIFMVIFGILGWWKNRRDFNVMIMILPFAVITTVHVFLLATTRYTFPVEPFMMILATWMVLKLFTKKSHS